jgi:hypothetical protein
MVLVRAPLSANRAGSGWPRRITEVICMIARAARATATIVTAAASAVAMI